MREGFNFDKFKRELTRVENIERGEIESKSEPKPDGDKNESEAGVNPLREWIRSYSEIGVRLKEATDDSSMSVDDRAKNIEETVEKIKATSLTPEQADIIAGSKSEMIKIDSFFDEIDNYMKIISDIYGEDVADDGEKISEKIEYLKRFISTWKKTNKSKIDLAVIRLKMERSRRELREAA